MDSDGTVFHVVSWPFGVIDAEKTTKDKGKAGALAKTL